MKELSRKQKKRVLDITLDDLAQANSYFTSKIEPLLRDRLSAYRAEKSLYERKFERLSARSDMRVFDFWATVESLIPPLMQSFFGADQIVSVVGREPEDAHKGELFKKLLDWQILEQNHGFLVFNDWFVDALRFELGVLKAHWIRDTQHEEVEETLDAEKIAVIAATPGVTILSCSETPDEYGLFDIRYQTSRMVENRPVIEVVHPFHLRWTPTAVSVETAPFVAQKKYVTGDELRRKAKRGIYDAKAVEAAIESAGSPDYSQIEQDLNDELGTSQNTADDSSRTVVELYECCVTMDADGDGLSENLLVTVANDQLLRVSENSYGRAPFFVISASRDPFKVCPDFGFAEVVSEIQHLKTAMVRLLVLNMSLNNTPRSFIDDTRVNHEDLLADKQYIRVNGQPGMAIYSQPIQPVAAWTMPFLEYTETLLEQWTGRTRYNQGLDANSLNKTATGATLIMHASTQRLGHLIRTFAETGVGQLYKFLVRMNQLYISNAQVFRLTNETLNISPDDMAGTYDIAIASDIGIGSRQSTIQNLQLFLGMLFPQGAQLGCCGPQEWANAARKLLRIIGIREVDALIREPQMQQPGFPPGMPQGMPGTDTGIPTEAMIAQAMSHRDPNMTGGERRVDGRAETPTFGKTFGTGNGKQDLTGLPPSLAGIASRDFVAQGG